MRAMLTFAVAATGLVAVLSAGCNRQVCPGGCPIGIFASFTFACSPNDVTSVVVTGPCSMSDGALVDVGPFGPSLGFSSDQAGTCHVQFNFASGFTYSADVTFVAQPNDGCCPTYYGPVSQPRMVPNPSSTCLPATDAGAEDAPGE